MEPQSFNRIGLAGNAASTVASRNSHLRVFQDFLLKKHLPNIVKEGYGKLFTDDTEATQTACKELLMEYAGYLFDEEKSDA